LRSTVTTHASLLDTRRGIETPEGARLAIKPAGPVPRFAAFGIDALIRMVVYSGIAQAVGVMGNLGFGVMLVMFFLVEWFYPVIFELAMNGATPGKRVMEIAVVMDNGLPVHLGASVTRNLLRAVDFLPVAYGFGIAAMFGNRDFKRLGDLAAGTVVAYRSTSVRNRALPDAAPVAIEGTVDRDLQLALTGLAERSVALTPERLDELTELVARAPLAARMRFNGPLSSRQRVFGVAQWLMGKR
jgi:uncharacterized RDD family membrane protein YckC